MPTQKPRFSIAIDEDLLKAVDDYKFDNRIKSQNQAINDLVRAGLNELSRIETEQIKNAPSDLSEEARRVALDYEALDRHGRRMTRMVIAEEQNRMAEERPMIQAAARGGGVIQIEEVRPEDLPDSEPIP